MYTGCGEKNFTPFYLEAYRGQFWPSKSHIRCSFSLKYEITIEFLSWGHPRAWGHKATQVYDLMALGRPQVKIAIVIGYLSEVNSYETLDIHIDLFQPQNFKMNLSAPEQFLACLNLLNL